MNNSTPDDVTPDAAAPTVPVETKVNLHDPVRHPDESLAQYDKRRAASNLVGKVEQAVSSRQTPRRDRKAQARASKPSGYTPPRKTPKERKRPKEGAGVIGAKKRLVNLHWQPPGKKAQP